MSKITIEIELPENLLLKCMLEAHKENITFNQWCEKVIRNYIESKN